jgi:hypothetical protein
MAQYYEKVTWKDFKFTSRKRAPQNILTSCRLVLVLVTLTLLLQTKVDKSCLILRLGDEQNGTRPPICSHIL